MKKNSATSISYPDFIKECKEAVENEELFKNFKSKPTISYVLGNLSKEQGDLYLNEIRKNPTIASNISKFKVNDILGNAEKYQYDIVEMSPTTLRYIHVLKDLVTNHQMDNFNIIEVGGGYGGQCAIIKTHADISKYSIVDIPGATDLTKKYLTALGISNNTEVINGNDRNHTYGQSYDLFISNYALSECVRETQQFYLDNIIKNCAHGYILFNEIGQGYGGYTLNEFSNALSRLGKETAVCKDTPVVCRSDNFLITW